MIKANEVRLGNLLFFNGQFVEVTSITYDKIGFVYYGLQKGQSEIFREPGHVDVSGFPLSIDFIKSQHFVDHGDNSDNNMPEYTDGRVILRFHHEGVSVFTPINMPFATPDFPIHIYFITQVQTLHELQNTYFDLFKEEMEVTL